MRIVNVCDGKFQYSNHVAILFWRDNVLDCELIYKQI